MFTETKWSGSILPSPRHLVGVPLECPASSAARTRHGHVVPRRLVQMNITLGCSWSPRANAVSFFESLQVSISDRILRPTVRGHRRKCLRFQPPPMGRLGQRWSRSIIMTEYQANWSITSRPTWGTTSLRNCASLLNGVSGEMSYRRWIGMVHRGQNTKTEWRHS
jgi:hypothetical protein